MYFRRKMAKDNKFLKIISCLLKKYQARLTNANICIWEKNNKLQLGT